MEELFIQSLTIFVTWTPVVNLENEDFNRAYSLLICLFMVFNKCFVSVSWPTINTCAKRGKSVI